MLVVADETCKKEMISEECTTTTTPVPTTTTTEDLFPYYTLAFNAYYYQSNPQSSRPSTSGLLPKPRPSTSGRLPKLLPLARPPSGPSNFDASRGVAHKLPPPGGVAPKIPLPPPGGVAHRPSLPMAFIPRAYTPSTHASSDDANERV